MPQDEGADKRVKVIDLDEFLDEISRKENIDKRKIRGRGIVRKIAELLAYNAVVTRGEIEEVSKGSSVGRQMISFLKNSGLVYETRSGYIISVPWILYLYKYMKDKWVKQIKRLAPALQDNEIEELRKIAVEALGTPLEKFIDAYIAAVGGLKDIAQIPVRCLPKKCEKFIDECFRQLLNYSIWLLTLITSLLELYVKGVSFGEVLEWLINMSKRNRNFLGFQEDHPLAYYNRLVAETSELLKRDALFLYQVYGKRKDDIMEKAIKWALQKYTETVGEDRARKGKDRAEYYARLFLDELSKATLADITTRIVLLI